MAHKNLKKGDGITKSFKLKCKVLKEELLKLWKPAIEEYNRYYNAVSDWICEHLTSLTIGDLAQFIDEKDKSNGYFTLTETYKDLPLYRLFTLPETNHAFNLLYRVIQKLNPENYNESNIMGLATSSYRKGGYFAAVVSNYRTKFATPNVKVKRRKLDMQNPTDESLLEQTIYEVTRNDFKEPESIKKYVEYLLSKVDVKQETLDRFNAIFKYYSENQELVNQKIEKMVVDGLKSFNGCHRSDECASMGVDYQKGKIIANDDLTFTISLTKAMTFDVFGHRQIVSFSNRKKEYLVHLDENHGQRYTFLIENGELYVVVTANCPYTNTTKEVNGNMVGIDVNTKHCMLSTDLLDDWSLNGYLNIYKELLKSEDFVATLTPSELRVYQKLSETVTFGLLETECWFEGAYAKKHPVDKDRLLKRNQAIYDCLKRLSKEWKDKDVYIFNYINHMKNLRDRYSSYFTLKEKYTEKQSEYDLEMGFVDKSTESKETMDKRRAENPFRNTETATELLRKMKKVAQDLIGSRDNIITYAYNVFKNNNINTICLEYLDNSNFEKKISLPTTASLLKYHKFEGKTLSEALIGLKRMSKDYYIFKTDDEGRIYDIEYSEKGLKKRSEDRFFNNLIKVIHFADAKDKFVQLSNNDDMCIVLVPSAFTSQMDSNTHKLLLNEEEKLFPKKSIRKCQEEHVNGLNADFNAAGNISFIASTPELLKELCEKSKSKYGNPSYTVKKSIKKNAPNEVIKRLKKHGYTETVKGSLEEFFGVTSLVNE